jgi:hypothetical protein
MSFFNLGSKEAFLAQSKIQMEPEKYFNGDSNLFFKKAEEIISECRKELFTKKEARDYDNFPKVYQMDFGGEFCQNALLFEFLKSSFLDIKRKKYLIVNSPSETDDGISLYYDLLIGDLNHEIGINKERIEFHEKLDYFDGIHNVPRLRKSLEGHEDIEDKIQLVKDFILDIQEHKPALDFVFSNLREAQDILSELENSRFKKLQEEFLRFQEFGLSENPKSLTIPVKLILLDQIGIIDLLLEYPNFQTSANLLADLLSLILGHGKTSIQPSISALINRNPGSKSHPYYSKKSVIEAKKILEKYSIPFKEK